MACARRSASSRLLRIVSKPLPISVRRPADVWSVIRRKRFGEIHARLLLAEADAANSTAAAPGRKYFPHVFSAPLRLCGEIHVPDL
jgi:hypothetical protein